MGHPLVTLSAREATKLANIFITDLRSKTGCVENIIKGIERDARKGCFEARFDIRESGDGYYPNKYSAPVIAKILRRGGYHVRIRKYDNMASSVEKQMHIYWGWKFRPLLFLEEVFLWLTFRY